MTNYQIMGHCQECEEYRILQKHGNKLLCEDCIQRRMMKLALLATAVFWLLMFVLVVFIAIKAGGENADSTTMHTIQQNIDSVRSNVHSDTDLA